MRSKSGPVASKSVKASIVVAVVVLAAWMLSITALADPARAGIYFDTAVQLPSIWYPRAVAIGDVDGDTHPDIVVLTDEGDSVATYLGIGNGAFAPYIGTRMSFVGNGNNVVLGNFNADSNLDIAWPSGGFLIFQAGDGAGGFGTPQLTFSPGSYLGHVATGDLNEDSKADLVVSYEDEPGAVGVHLGNGDGTFDGGATFGTSPSAEGIAVADFNNDTHLDLAVACRGTSVALNVVSILMGNGDGTFSGKTDYVVSLEPFAVAVGDFNNDTKLDLATTGLDGKVAVVLGNGAGAFGTKMEYTIGAEGRSLAAGDLDGDGNLDLLVPDHGLFGGGTQMAALRGVGDGTFDTPTFIPTGRGPTDVAIADLNHDGKLDAVVADATFHPIDLQFQVSVLLNCVPCPTTAVSVVLDRIETSGGHVRVRWIIPGGSVLLGTIQRRLDGGDWVDLTSPAPIEGPTFTYYDASVTPGMRYAYRLSLRDLTDAWFTNEAWILVPTAEAAPGSLSLRAPFPNPSRDAVSFHIGRAGEGHARLRVFDVHGREVARIDDGRRAPGWATVAWDGRTLAGQHVPSGVYFAVLHQGRETVTRRFVLSR